MNNTAKTYTVRNFSDLTGTGSIGANVKIDVKETGQKKMVNGFMASEIVMTMQADSPQPSPMGQMQMEMDLWVSPDVPGSAPMADMQFKMASLHGVTVESIVRMKSASGAAGMPQMSGAQSDQMAKARVRLEALIARGGAGAAAAKMALDRMPGGSPAGGSGSGAMIEITSDSSDFSTAAITDSVFAIPAGYQKGN